jgi:acyl-CoA reductase-like NAD-dependent aldehyde dehydrogenase
VSTPAPASVRLPRRQLLIDGRWAEAAGERSVLNPATNQPLASVAEASAADVDRAAQAARRAFDEGPWPRLSAGERGRILLRVAALMEQYAAELAELESLNNGKPIRESRLIDVPLSTDCFEYFAGFATKVAGETLPVPGAYLAYTLREPVGVVGAITPFNFPLLMAAWKIAPALAFGNTVVIKPSEETPLTTLRLAELCMEAGVPPGALNVVTGGPEAGAALVAHPLVDKIAFTGSTPVGKQIAARSADTLKRVSLELGGKAPNLVLADARIEEAVAGCLFGVFWTQGQICTAGSRILVQRSIYDRFVEAFARRAGALRVGDPLDERTQVGPLISRRQQERVLRYIESGKQEGARLAAGGGAPPAELAQGNFVMPTVFADVRNDMTIAREEIFGPVASVLPFDSVNEAIRTANETIYGLTAGVWTNDVRQAHRIAQAIRAGTIWINSYNVVTSEAPFGGFKQSGFGREMGPHAVELYTEVKQVYLALADETADWFLEGGG